MTAANFYHPPFTCGGQQTIFNRACKLYTKPRQLILVNNSVLPSAFYCFMKLSVGMAAWFISFVSVMSSLLLVSAADSDLRLELASVVRRNEKCE